MQARLSIGAVAKQTGIPASTIRFYEAQGVLPPPARTAAGYRTYTPDDVRRIRLALRARFLRMDLAKIRDLVQRAFSSDCADFADQLLQRIEAHHEQVVRQIAALESLRLELQAAADHVRHARGVATPGQRVSECSACPLIDDEGR
jgi:DNA-binding transcriptional MerR regulator